MGTSDPLEWIPARGLPPRVLGFTLLLCAVAESLVVVVGVSVGPSGLQHALELAPSAAIGPDTIAIVWVFGIVLPIIVVVGALGVPEVRIGLSTGGVKLVSRFRTREVRWEELWPSYAMPPLHWVLVAYRTEGRPCRRFFWASAAQARALSTHPGAPFNLFPPELREWLARAP